MQTNGPLPTGGGNTPGYSPGEEKKRTTATASLNIVMAFHCEMLKLAVIRC